MAVFCCKSILQPQRIRQGKSPSLSLQCTKIQFNKDPVLPKGREHSQLVSRDVCGISARECGVESAPAFLPLQQQVISLQVLSTPPPELYIMTLCHMTRNHPSRMWTHTAIYCMQMGWRTFMIAAKVFLACSLSFSRERIAY